jgi:hypothetical protein
LATLFVLLTTDDSCACAVAIAAVVIFIAALDGAITAGSPSHTTTTSLANQLRSVAKYVFDALQPRIAAGSTTAASFLVSPTAVQTCSRTLSSDYIVPYDSGNT